MSEARHIEIRGAMDVAEVRFGTFEDRQHVVVPVVALVGDAVVSPMGSNGPELVPSEVLAAAPSGWNGRPIVGSHPVSESGAPLSANELEVLESRGFGRIFNAKFEDGRLKLEAWIDPERAVLVGEEAVSVLERVAAKEPVEISVGAFVFFTAEDGETPEGVEYSAVWEVVIPDHLAMLPEGAVGACSVEMGCGAPRNNHAELNPYRGGGYLNMLATEGEQMSEDKSRIELTYLAGLWDGRLAESDVKLRERMGRMLYQTIPAFAEVLEIDPKDKTVIYATFVEGLGAVYYRASYSEKKDGLQLVGEPEPVLPQTEFASLAAAEEHPAELADDDKAEIKDAAQGACPCEAEQNAQMGDNDEGDSSMSTTNKALIDRLIACDRAPFDESDRGTLEALTSEKLEVMATAMKGHDPDAVVLNAAEYEALRAAYDAAEAADKAQADSLIAKITEGSDLFSTEELETRPIDELEKLATLVEAQPKPEVEPEPEPVRDFSAQATPVTRKSTVPAIPKAYSDNLSTN